MQVSIFISKHLVKRWRASATDEFFAEHHVKGYPVADLRWNDMLPLREPLYK